MRLGALKNDPLAFSSSYEEEKALSENEWRIRIKNTLFALLNDKPVGMVVYIINNKLKTAHIAEIFGVYVINEYRGQGVGNKLIEVALRMIQMNTDTSKIKVKVNSEQKVAVKLYDKYGFEMVGRLRKELKVDSKFYDELIMEKHI